MALPVGPAKRAHYTRYITFFHFLTPENPGAHYTMRALYMEKYGISLQPKKSHTFPDFPWIENRSRTFPGFPRFPYTGHPE